MPFFTSPNNNLGSKPKESKLSQQEVAEVERKLSEYLFFIEENSDPKFRATLADVLILFKQMTFLKKEFSGLKEKEKSIQSRREFVLKSLPVSISFFSTTVSAMSQISLSLIDFLLGKPFDSSFKGGRSGLLCGGVTGVMASPGLHGHKEAEAMVKRLKAEDLFKNLEKIFTQIENILRRKVGYNECEFEKLCEKLATN